MKKQKQKLLEQIDLAINSSLTSDKQKELLREIKEELKSATSRREYIEIALKVASLLIALTKVLLI